MKRELKYDFIRTCACICIVAFHVTAYPIYKFNELPRIQWIIVDIIKTTTVIGVPCFFMLTGSLLLAGHDDLYTYLWKRVSRIVIPFLFWSLAYLFYRIHYQKEALHFSSELLHILSSPMYYHLWFIYTLIGLYLFIPILRRYLQGSENIAPLIYYILLWLITMSIIPFLRHFLLNVYHIDFGINIMIDVSQYVGFVLLGYLITNKDKYELHLRNRPILLIFIICILATATITLIFSTKQDKPVLYFMRYLAPNIVLLSVASYWLINEISIDLFGNSFKRIIVILSKASLGIYLIHPMVLDLLHDGVCSYTLTGCSGNPMIGIPATTFACLVCSFVFTWLLQQIPILRKVV